MSFISDLKLRVKIHEKDADTSTILKCVILTELKGIEEEMFKSESVELGITQIGSISTSIVTTTKKALKTIISIQKVSDRVKAFIQTNISASLRKTHGCILNKKKDYDSDDSQLTAPGRKKKNRIKNKKLSTGKQKIDYDKGKL